MNLSARLLALSLGLASIAALAVGQATHPTPPPHTASPELVIFDTDIGDDIDDVLALSLLLKSPELHLLGVTAAWGDTALRARMVDRLLDQAGVTGVPVLVGPVKHHAGQGLFSQATWARRGPTRPHGDAVQFLLDQARAHPGQITLLSVAPMTNLGAALERDPAAFRMFKRIVLMGGSIHRGYGDLGYTATHRPDAEYNIKMDAPAAASVFRSGVPLFVMPLDSTQLKLNEVHRQLLFTQSTPLTDAMALLYAQWSRVDKLTTPTMYDAVAVAYAVDPTLCPVVPMHLDVDSAGFTRPGPGAPNAQVCLESNSEAFFRFFIPRLLAPEIQP